MNQKSLGSRRAGPAFAFSKEARDKDEKAG